MDVILAILAGLLMLLSWLWHNTFWIICAVGVLAFNFWFAWAIARLEEVSWINRQVEQTKQEVSQINRQVEQILIELKTGQKSTQHILIEMLEDHPKAMDRRLRAAMDQKVLDQLKATDQKATDQFDYQKYWQTNK
jgi:hypothetical protein